MCGIISIYNPKKKIEKKTLTSMLDSLKHRGPNSQGIKMLAEGKLGLGNARLATVDLHARSNQPLDIGRYVITFNGEIYNYKDLREKLKKLGCHFRTLSDTEVIIRAVEKWGMDALHKFNGCFAFILYDKENKKMIVARDPLGEKQLVYSKAKNGDWAFSSEIKSLLKHSHIVAEPNVKVFIGDLIFKFFTDKKETHFKNIYNVPAGHYFIFDLATGKEPILKKYWDIDRVQLKKYSKQDIPSIVRDFKTILEDSVRLKINADTEVGSILSGGIDSSLMTKMAVLPHDQMYRTPLQCFTIKYLNRLNRDLKNARLLVRRLKNVSLEEIKVDTKLQLKDIDSLIFTVEEPPLDKVYFAQLANYKAAKDKRLRVVLNGQGSDELWLGYYYYYDIFQLPEKEINFNGLKNYWMRRSPFFQYIKGVKGKKEAAEIIKDNLKNNFSPYATSDKLESLESYSIKTHLQSIFYQEDRMSMANSVEVRLPHIDSRITELALSIPSRFKLLGDREKYFPRAVGKLNNFLPKEIYTRRKLGFPYPPDKFDRYIENLFNKEEVYKSNILREIFGRNVKEFFHDLTIRDRWILLAISRMEKIFFKK